MRPTLLILASGNFALATGAFVVPGLLAQLSADLGISLAAGGALMTSYAIAYAVASPLLVAATGAWTRRSVLLVGLVLVAVGNLGMAVAGDLPTAVAARVVSAVGGALYTPIAAAIAVAVSPPERRTRALALVFAGMTLAQVLGIPLGTQVAFAVGWRMVFVAVAVLALLAAVAVAASVPRDLDLPPATLPQLGRLLLEPHVAVAIAVTILFFAGNFVVMTFLGPVLTATSGATGAILTGILWALGVAAVVANGLGGWAGDRFGPLPTLAVMIVVTAAVVSNPSGPCDYRLGGGAAGRSLGPCRLRLHDAAAVAAGDARAADAELGPGAQRRRTLRRLGGWRCHRLGRRHRSRARRSRLGRWHPDLGVARGAGGVGQDQLRHQRRAAGLMPAAVQAAPATPGMLAPLRRPGVFRMVWTANLISALGTTVQGVGAAWLMTSLAGTPDMVALVQTALLLPILLFALPAGALADTFDRRLVLIWAQLWIAAVSFTLAALGLLGLIDPLVLLVFTFFVGSGTALNGPAWQAAVREIVPRDELAAAVTLNAIAFNIARAVGPAIGGALVASFGAEAAFIVNAVSSLALIVAILLWNRPVAPDDLPREGLAHAMITGLRYVQETPAIRAVLARGGVFGLVAAAALALLPLVARDTLQGGAALYGVLLGAFGAGALAGAFAIHPLRQRRGAEFVVTVLSGMFGASLLVLAFWPAQLPVMLALALAGAAWLGSFSTFNISVQMVTAPWVQARVLALYQTTVFGTMAFGSWAWGELASLIGLDLAQGIAGALLLASLALHRLLPLSGAAAPDLGPMTSRLRTRSRSSASASTKARSSS